MAGPTRRFAGVSGIGIRDDYNRRSGWGLGARRSAFGVRSSELEREQEAGKQEAEAGSGCASHPRAVFALAMLLAFPRGSSAQSLRPANRVMDGQIVSAARCSPRSAQRRRVLLQLHRTRTTRCGCSGWGSRARGSRRAGSPSWASWTEDFDGRGLRGLRPLPPVARSGLESGRPDPPGVGAFSRHAYSTDNTVIALPLAYQYLNSIRPDAVRQPPWICCACETRGGLSESRSVTPHRAPASRS